MSYQAVLFDLDGVIVHSEPLYMAAFQSALRNHGHDLTEAQYKEHFAGRTNEAGFKRYFAATGAQADLSALMDEASKAYLDLTGSQLVAYPGVVELIQELAARQVPLALVTGSWRAEAEAALQARGIDTCFRAVIAAEDISHSKPDPEGYLKAAQALQVEPADCVVVEDAPSGVAAAQAAGMRCVAVTNTHAPAELQAATLIVDRLAPGCLDTL